MTLTPNVNTSREAVERLAELWDHTRAAATLRALLAERDAARAELNDVLAKNDAIRFVLNNARAEIAAAYRAGAEAMRSAIRESIRAYPFDLKNSGPRTDAIKAIDATPLPEMEARRHDGE